MEEENKLEQCSKSGDKDSNQQEMLTLPSGSPSSQRVPSLDAGDGQNRQTQDNGKGEPGQPATLWTLPPPKPQIARNPSPVGNLSTRNFG